MMLSEEVLKSYEDIALHVKYTTKKEYQKYTDHEPEVSKFFDFSTGDVIDDQLLLSNLPKLEQTKMKSFVGNYFKTCITEIEELKLILSLSRQLESDPSTEFAKSRVRPILQEMMKIPVSVDAVRLFHFTGTDIDHDIDHVDGFYIYMNMRYRLSEMHFKSDHERNEFVLKHNTPENRIIAAYIACTSSFAYQIMKSMNRSRTNPG